MILGIFSRLPGQSEATETEDESHLEETAKLMVRGQGCDRQLWTIKGYYQDSHWEILTVLDN